MLSESSNTADTEEATERSKHLDDLAKVSEIFGLDASGLAEGPIPVVHLRAIDFAFALDVGFLHPAAGRVGQLARERGRRHPRGMPATRDEVVIATP
jgi:hypothetical protein